MAQEAMPWDEYQSTPATGQGVVIQPKGPTAIDQTKVGIDVSSEERSGRKEQFDNAKNLRDEFRKSEEAKNYEVVMRQFSSALGAKTNPTGDQALITAYAKMLDPASVVREAEFNIVQAGDSAIGKQVARLQKELGIDESGLIRPEVRNRVLTEMKNLTDNYRQSYDRVRTDYEGLAGSYGIDPKLVLGSRIDDPYLLKVEKAWKEKGIDQTADQTLAISGGEQFSTETDNAIADAVNQVIAQGGGVQELVAAAQGAGGQVQPEDLAAFQQAVEARSKGQSVTFNPQQSGRRSPIAQAAGEALMTPAGTALTGAVNAVGMGALSQFAGDQVQGLEALNPKAALTGEVIGSALGTAGLAKGAGAALGAVAPNLAGRLAGGGLAGAAGRELATDVAYGGIYGANTGEGFGTGAALGAVGSLGGQAVGAGVRRAAPAVGGAIGRMLGREGGEVVPPTGGAPDGAPVTGAPAMGAEEPFTPTTTRGTDAGAAGTSEETIRAQRAAELPVPIELARFQRSRLFTEQQRARELAKNNEIGGPIRQRLSEQQEALRQNFDKFIDETGSEVWENARDKGVVVDTALKKLADVGKTRTRILYKRAEKAGEMQEPIPYSNIKAFIDEQDVTTREKLAPVLDAVANQLRKNDPEGTGQIPINALESVRKLINKVAQPGTPDATFGAELKGLIDTATEGKGGDLYQQARASRIKYANTFENAGLVKKLMGTKPGTVDRQVALEKVAEQAIYSRGTALDDIKSLKNVLDQASTRGERAWKELQGATLEHIRDQAYKGITRDESGKPVISAAALNRVVTELDASGKLDYVLGRKTADLLRTINDVAKDVVTAPPGSINTSGTSSAILNALDTAATFGVSGVPIPAAKLIGSFKNAMQNRELRKEVKRLLD